MEKIGQQYGYHDMGGIFQLRDGAKFVGTLPLSSDGIAHNSLDMTGCMSLNALELCRVSNNRIISKKLCASTKHGDEMVEKCKEECKKGRMRYETALTSVTLLVHLLSLCFLQVRCRTAKESSARTTLRHRARHQARWFC